MVTPFDPNATFFMSLTIEDGRAIAIFGVGCERPRGGEAKRSLRPRKSPAAADPRCGGDDPYSLGGVSPRNCGGEILPTDRTPSRGGDTPGPIVGGLRRPSPHSSSDKGERAGDWAR